MSGARREQLPDVIVTWTGAPPAERIYSDKLGAVSGRLATGRAGNHRPGGFWICLAATPNNGLIQPPAHIADVASTVMRMLVPIPEAVCIG
jgi:hypothetical protein